MAHIAAFPLSNRNPPAGGSGGLPAGLSYNSDGGGAGADEFRVSNRVVIEAPAGARRIGIPASEVGVSFAGVALTLTADTNTFIQVATADAVRIAAGGGYRVVVNPNGDILLGSAALATNATAGDVRVPVCAGVPTGVPTSGQGSLRSDGTGGKLYHYNDVTDAWDALT